MKIVIIGCGFAGLAACKKISKQIKRDSNHEIVLFDKHNYTTMVPSLPDVVGERVSQRFLVEEIAALTGGYKRVTFIRKEIRSISLQEKSVSTESETYTYDVLIVAAGSTPNFYGFSQNVDKMHCLQSLDDALTIKNDFIEYLAATITPQIVVVGGGYTGIELACNLITLSSKYNKNLQVFIVEIANDILGPIPEKLKDYLKNTMLKDTYSILTKTRITSFDGQNVTLSNGQTIENAFVCWCAGSKFPIAEVTGNCCTIGDGRIIVNEYLQIPQYEDVFVAGDCAAIKRDDSYIRKAVNFSIYSGKCAGENAGRLLSRKPLKRFKPVDLGWVIPLCRTSVGKLLGKITVKGKIGLALHYMMCGYRNYNAVNSFYYFKKAIASLFKRKDSYERKSKRK